MNPKQLTAQHLQLFRKHYRLTQAQAAQFLGVSRITWIRWESGTAPPPLYLYHALRGLIAAMKEDAGT